MVAAIQGDSGREKIKDFLVFGTGVAVAFVSNQQNIMTGLDVG